jgi:hypothetical protein
MRGKRAVIVIAQGGRGFYAAGPCLQMLDWTFRYLDMPAAGRIVVVGHAAGQTVDLQPPWFHLGYWPDGRLGGVFYLDGSGVE